MALINVVFNEDCANKKFGDVYNVYSQTQQFGDRHMDSLSIDELNAAINDNMQIKVGGLFGGFNIGSQDATNVIWDMINSDEDNEHITTDEIDKFLENTDYSFDDLAEMNLEEAVDILIQTGTKNIF